MFFYIFYFFLIGIFTTQVNATPSGNRYGEELTGLPFSPSNVDVDSEGRIFAGSAQGLYRSTDRGSTWTQVNDTAGAVMDIYIDSRDYVFIKIGTNLYRSTNQGTDWTNIGVISEPWMWDEDSNGYIYVNNYAVAENDYIYRSTDQGASFQVWYNVSASPNPVRHVHSVDVAPNDYVFFTTGDSDITEIDDNTIRRWNGTAWEILVESTATNDHEPRSIAIWFLGDYAYTAWDLSSYMYRFPITGTWAEREKIIISGIGTSELYDAIVIDDMAFLSTDAGYIFASWDGVHWAKIFEISTGAIIRFSSRKSFPLYFVDWENNRLFRLNQVTKEDLVQLFYATYNSERGSVTNAENYVLEQRIYNGTNHLDLTSVALSNVQASIKGLSKENKLTNGGFETGDKTGWTTIVAGNGTVSTNDKYEGTYSFQVDHSDGLCLIRQQTSVRKGDTVIVSWYMKSNDTIASKINLYLQNASAGYTNLNTYLFTSVTSWTKTEIVKRYDVETPFTLAFAFRFESASLLTYFDASVVRLPEVAYQNFNGDDLIAYNPEFFNSTYFVGMINTTDPSLTINGQTIPHSGELTNGTESSATNLTGILTGAVRVDANISGSKQAILRITGTRILNVTNATLQGRIDNVYYGRYYSTPAINATDLVVLANEEANITSLSYANSRLDFSVNSPSNTTSSTKVYWPYTFAPRKVECTTSNYDWSHNLTTNITTLNATHSSDVDWTLYVQLSDGESCSSNDECLNGYCVHGICRSSSTYCGDNYCDTGEDCSSCSSDCGCSSGYYCSNGQCASYGTIKCKKEGEFCLMNASCCSGLYCIDDLCKNVTVALEEEPEEVLECPVCPSPSVWGECVEGKQSRTDYRCSEETNYTCESYVEERSCEVPLEKSEIAKELIIGIIILMIVAVIVIIFFIQKVK